jgi:hypothetical protein
MKLSVFTALTALTLGASVLIAGGDVHAQAAKSAPKAGKAPAAAPGVISKKVGLAPKGFRFGLSLEGIAALYDKVYDEEFLPLYKKAQPGPEMDALDEELKQKKQTLRRSRLEFGNTPTGMDYTALKPEYSYGNAESMGRLTLRSGTERYLFFFNDVCWKLYDEHKLAKGGPLGENFEEAIKVLTERFGAPPKRIPSDFEKGQSFDEALWADPEKYIRAVDRGGVLGMVYIDKATQDSLASKRKNKPQNLHAMDSDVSAVLKKEAPPTPPVDDKSKKKKAK